MIFKIQSKWKYIGINDEGDMWFYTERPKWHDNRGNTGYSDAHFSDSNDDRDGQEYISHAWGELVEGHEEMKPGNLYERVGDNEWKLIEENEL